ncbi:hypothetical protein ISS42_03310, partial [Candidatus Shapirobacteria bacterium]|nr:hypothetical protein [Candidatus Shapirobacteria bacterium]
MDNPPDNLKNKPKDLTGILLSKALLDEKQVEEVRLLHLSSGKKEEEIIRQKGWLDTKVLLEAKAEFWKVPYIDLSSQGFSPQSFELVPKNL